MIAAKEIMTKKIISVPRKTSLLEADRLMKEKRIRHLPVVDERGHIIGVFSSRDMVYLDDMGEISVDCLMRTPVFCVDENTSLRSTILKFLEKKISCALISDETNHAVGILTTDDLLWYLAHLLNDEEANQKSALGATQLLRIGEVAQSLANAGV